MVTTAFQPHNNKSEGIVIHCSPIFVGAFLFEGLQASPVWPSGKSKYLSFKGLRFTEVILKYAFRTVKETRFVSFIKADQLMIYREIIAFLWALQNTEARCVQNVETVMLNLVVHKVTAN